MDSDPAKQAENDLSTLENNLGYQFKNSALLRRALIHPSWCKEHPEDALHNQRLEFLGDAVLSMIIAERLFRDFPSKREGFLTRQRAMLTKGDQLVSMARSLQIAPHILLAEAVEKHSGRDRSALLEDTLEAIVGALYLDAGWETTCEVVLNWYGDLAKHLEDLQENHNPKGTLQEMVQARQGNNTLVYELTRIEGPPHQRTFFVSARVNDQILGQGSGHSKKSAEEHAAREALQVYSEFFPSPPD